MFREALPDARHLLDLFKAVNAVAGPIPMLPAPGRATIASIIYRLFYNLVRALLTLFIIAPLLSPIILLALQYCNIPFLGGAAA